MTEHPSTLRITMRFSSVATNLRSVNSRKESGTGASPMHGCPISGDAGRAEQDASSS